MTRLGFILTAPCSGGERLGSWLATQRSVFVTENMLFGRFFEQWPTEKGATVPAITVDRFVTEWSRTARLALLGIDRPTFQNRFMDRMIDLIVEFGLEQSQRHFMLDLLMPFPGTQTAVDEGLAAQRPHTPVVRLVRDGRDMLVDQAFRWLLRDTHGTNRYAFFVERRPNLKLARFFDDLFLERWARTWRDAALSNLGRPASEPLRTITYEAWSQTSEAVLSALTDEFKLVAHRDPATRPSDSPSSVSSEAKPATAEKPTNLDRLLQRIRTLAAPLRSSIGTWPIFFTREDGKLFHLIAGEALLRHGYVSDDRWYESLPEKLDSSQLDRFAETGELRSAT